MKRVLFTLAFLAATAGAYAEDIAFFEKTYNVKLTGIKLKSEYPDPDQFYTAIAKQLGIPKLALTAVEKEYGWKQQEGQRLIWMVKRSVGRWDVLITRMALDEKTQRADFSTMEMAGVEIDDAKKISVLLLPDDRQAVSTAALTQDTEQILKKVLKAIDGYVADVGSAPARLEDLALNPGDEYWKGPYWPPRERMAGPWGRDFVCESRGTKAVLVSSGPDKTMGTGDDIRISH